ncbi:hypothetical protein GOP47_0010117 [Adiantum capillus-veneris]|uniref:Uncharacterized protein n=1 Tax=Adiantum capillus-veneris TaxID=13818 RepID=A0A9D4ZIG8_ADICA|nr:hypothetical protein GOP47_0010117 [Adiantum capillus-veneris]
MIFGMNGEVLWLGKDEKLDKLLPELFVWDYLRARWRSLPSMAKLTGGNFGLISVTIGGYAYFTGDGAQEIFIMITADAAKIQYLLCVGDKLWAFLETDDQDSNTENSLLWIYAACVREVPARWEWLPLCIKVLQGSSRASVREVPARWEWLPLCIKVLQGSSRAISMKLAETD